MFFKTLIIIKEKVMEDNKVGNIIYHEPEDNFKKVNFEVIKNFDCMTIGLYCKIIAMSAEWKLNINGLATVLDISKEKVKTSIQKLERYGFMKREPVKNENGKFAGYSYHFYPLPLPMEERTMAGYKKNGVAEERGTRKMGYPENDAPNNNRYKDNNRKEKRENNKLFPPKKEEITFEDFYKLYPVKKSRVTAERAWAKLSEKEKEKAKEILPIYIADCAEHKRQPKYPATYLNQKTWEDDFSDSYEEEVNEEIPEERLEGWHRSQDWMNKAIPRIAGKIGFKDFDTMRGTVYHNRDVFSEILHEINNSDYEGDIVAEFCRLAQTERYNQKIFGV